MKTRVLFFIGILLLSYSFTNSKELPQGTNPSPGGSVNVYTSPDLYNLTVKWSNEYSTINPKLKINVIKSADDNVAAMLKKGDGIGFINDQSFATTDNQNGWNMIVGRDVIVPVMNAANPMLDEITRKGLSQERLAKFLKNPMAQNWGTLTGNLQNASDKKVTIYLMNDPEILSGIERFLNNDQLNIEGIKVSNPQEMISAIQKDPGALGFCKLIQIMNPDNQNLAENIRLVPLDKNGNGKIDYMENIYENPESFNRGVWIGKYPKALAGNIYMVSAKKPIKETELAFMNWVLTDGQQFLNNNGYNDLVLSERHSQLDKINEPVQYTAKQPNEFLPVLRIILMAIFAFVIIGILIDLIVRRVAGKKKVVVSSTSGLLPFFDENSVVIPKGLYFDKTHTWSFMKKDGTVKIGIDDFIQHVTGPLTRIEMKSAGEKIKKGERLFTIIQKGKQLNIYSPISGTITANNDNLISNSSLLNDSPYADGWIYTIEPTNWSLEIQYLTMAEKYTYWIRDEFSRLKDFLARAAKSHAPEYALVTLQDGGALKDSVLADLGPEIWDDFQTKFIDKSKI